MAALDQPIAAASPRPRVPSPLECAAARPATHIRRRTSRGIGFPKCRSPDKCPTERTDPALRNLKSEGVGCRALNAPRRACVRGGLGSHDVGSTTARRAARARGHDHGPQRGDQVAEERVRGRRGSVRAVRACRGHRNRRSARRPTEERFERRGRPSPHDTRRVKRGDGGRRPPRVSCRERATDEPTATSAGRIFERIPGRARQGEATDNYQPSFELTQ